jgi:pimeloyl-ACP methyl ester carboxylesterase
VTERLLASGTAGRVAAGDVCLAYRYVEGARRQPLLLFLHEGLGSISLWRDFPDEIAERTGLPALIYDRAGYGGSGPLPCRRDPRYLHDYAWRELPALLEAFNEARPLILIGHSDGGTIALLFAARHPNRVIGLATLAAHVRVENETLEGIRQATAEYRRGALRDRLERHHGPKTDRLFHAWSDTWLDTGFLGWNIESDLTRVACPVLALQGADDEYGTPGQLHSIQTHVSGPCETLLIPDCGHSPQFQSRPTTANKIVGFVAALDPATA